MKESNTFTKKSSKRDKNEDLSKNHNRKIKYRIREQEEQEAEAEIQEFIYEDPNRAD